MSAVSARTNFADLTGQRFYRLTVIKRVENIKSAAAWLCRCDCGKETIVISHRLTHGRSRSCGCYSAELKTVHGERHTRLYNIWSLMKDRCQNKSNNSFLRYGGAGINICEEWKDFLPFRNWAVNNGYDESLTIDRVDGTKGYCPENCRWATKLEQVQNRKYTIWIEHDGQKKTIKEWSEVFGIKYKTAVRRYHAGCNFQRLFRPLSACFHTNDIGG